MKTLTLTMASAALLAALPAAAQVMSPAEYVKTAGASDLYEQQSAQIVLQTTQNPQVRAFAEMMIAQHGKSTADVKAAAARSRVRVAPPMLMPTQSELIAQLRAEPAATRDAAYIAHQKAAHGQALAVQKAYAASGTAAPLKAAAAKIVPVGESHIAMLMKM